ncbi:MAG: hypothetical protein U9O55_02550 [Patescibacteria group bacterium]|nr:hypothetical protein [Patescibacteria group bacterium]
MARKNGKNGKNDPSRHHIIPSTRGGGDEKENIKMLPRGFHNNWHDVFGNLTPLESIQFIKEVFLDEMSETGLTKKRPKRRWRWDELYNLQLSIQKRTIRNKRLNKRRKK